jgi:hypothetical protein
MIIQNAGKNLCVTSQNTGIFIRTALRISKITQNQSSVQLKVTANIFLTNTVMANYITHK